jgi:hypothetical protein
MDLKLKIKKLYQKNKIKKLKLKKISKHNSTPISNTP